MKTATTRIAVDIALYKPPQKNFDRVYQVVLVYSIISAAPTGMVTLEERQ